MNMLNTMYLGSTKPFNTQTKNRLEMFNDFCVFNCTLGFMLFTDYVDDLELQYEFGFMLIGVISFNGTINLIIIFYQIFLKLKLIVTKYYRRVVFKFKKSTAEN